MCNEEISSMLKMRFCTPMLLYQSMLLVVLPDTDFNFNTPPKKNSNKKTHKTPTQNATVSSKQQQKEKSEASIIC